MEKKANTMEYHDTIKLSNGKTIQRYWKYFSGKKEMVEITLNPNQ